jgi:hypothetical protein
MTAWATGPNSAEAYNKRETPRRFSSGFLNFNPGNDLLSHRVTPAVSSAREGLTTVFGMGTGVTPRLWPPGNFELRLTSLLAYCRLIKRHLP